jgi:hypothetical protein
MSPRADFNLTQIKLDFFFWSFMEPRLYQNIKLVTRQQLGKCIIEDVTGIRSEILKNK